MIETSLEAEEDVVSGSAPRIECPYALTLVRVGLSAAAPAAPIPARVIHVIQKQLFGEKNLTRAAQ